MIAFAGLLAVSHRGLFGSISHTVGTLTNPNAAAAHQRPRAAHRDRQRARALLERSARDLPDHPLLGVGAEGYETARLRYRTAILNVGQAHGFIVQTLADLGLVGLLVVLALLGTWIVRRWARHASLQPTLAALALVAAPGRGAPLLRRARRAAHAGLRRRDVRHPLLRGLDLVRPRRRVRRFAVRRLGGWVWAVA